MKFLSTFTFRHSLPENPPIVIRNICLTNIRYLILEKPLLTSLRHSNVVILSRYH